MKKIILSIGILGFIIGMLFATTTYLAAENDEKEPVKQVLDFTGENLVLISGPIKAENAITAAQRLEQLSLTNEKTVDIFINSPGGEVDSGIVILNAMDLVKARGKVIRCAVGVLSASMAMHILGKCDERYAFENSLLLFHEIYTGGFKITEKTARQIAETMRVLSEKLDRDLRKALGASKDNYTKHLEAETMWTGYQMGKEFPNFNLKMLKDLKLPPNTPIFTM